MDDFNRQLPSGCLVSIPIQPNLEGFILTTYRTTYSNLLSSNKDILIVYTLRSERRTKNLALLSIEILGLQGSLYCFIRIS